MPEKFVRVGGNGTAPGRSLWMWCPGCDDAHRITFDHPNGWTWDGNEEAPTITPSIFVNDPSRPHPGKPSCHSVVTAGSWYFFGDCSHALAGQTVPMVPLPEWLNDDYVGGSGVGE